MLNVDAHKYHMYSEKISHQENGDNAFSLVFDSLPSELGKLAIFCVFDGVTNTDGAQKSSSMAAQVIRTELLELLKNVENLAEADETVRMRYFFSMMKKAILSADGLLWDISGNYACTASIAIVFGKCLYTANIGDSPIYLFDTSDESLTELFTCHNEAMFKVRRGELTKEEAFYDKSKNHILKVVGGVKQRLEASDVATMKIDLPQDSILLVGSDGSLGVFNENILTEIIKCNPFDMSALCDEIFNRVKEEGGGDDSTLIAVKLDMGL